VTVASDLVPVTRLLVTQAVYMIIGKSKKELEKMRAAGQLVGLVLQDLREMVEPGITTIEIDRRAEKMIRAAGALPITAFPIRSALLLMSKWSMGSHQITS
jgi:hypothetical protein